MGAHYLSYLETSAYLHSSLDDPLVLLAFFDFALKNTGRKNIQKTVANLLLLLLLLLLLRLII